MVQFGEKIWFHKIGVEGINSSRKRRIQGIFVGHHDRTRAIPCIAKSGIVRGQKSDKADFAPQGKVTEPCRDEFRERVGMTVEKTLTGEARIDTCKDRIAETERVKERKRARVERGAGDGDKDDEQVAVRHADASGGYIIENQHEEEIMRDIQVRIRGSGATREEQTDSTI